MTALRTTAGSTYAKIAPSFTIEEVVDPGLLLPRLTATSKIGAIKELVDRMHERSIITDRLSFLQSVLEREQLQSTILNGEVALPHARGRSVHSLGLAMGIAQTPIDFPSGDERRAVRLICLIAVPAHAPDLYLNLLGMLARILSASKRTDALVQAESAEQMRQLLLQSV